MRRVSVLLAVSAFSVAVYACTDGPSDEATGGGELSVSAGIDGRSIVAVKSSAHARTCPGAVLPRGIVLAARACVATSGCEPIAADALRVIAGDGASAQVEAQVSFTVPPPRPASCSEFVALRLVGAFDPAVAPPLKVRVGPVPATTVLDVVTFRGHEAPVTSDAGASDAEADAEGDAQADADAAEPTSDAAGPDPDSGDVSDAHDAELDAGTDASSDAGGAAVDADAATSLGRIVRRVAVTQTVQGDGSALIRRFEVAPNVGGFAIAVDKNGTVAGISDGSSVYAEPSTLPGFDSLVRLYPFPSDVLDLPAPPVEEAGAPSGTAAPREDPPAVPSAGPPAPRPTGGETTSCAISISSRGSNGTAFVLLAIGGLLVISRRRETRSRLRGARDLH